MAFSKQAEQDLAVRMVLVHEILPVEVESLATIIALPLEYSVDTDGIHGTLEGRDVYLFEPIDSAQLDVENMGPWAVAAYMKAQARAFVQQVRELVLTAPPIQENFFFKASVLQSLFLDPKSPYLTDLKGKS